MTEEICAARRCERDPTLGLLCGEHGQRLADHYGAREGHGTPGRESHGLPWAYDHIQLAYPSLTGRAGNGGKSDIDDTEAEKLSAVMTLRADIAWHLVEVSADLTERLGRKGPPSAPSQRLMVIRSARWLLTHIEPLRAAQGVQATSSAVSRAAARAAHAGTDVHTVVAELDAATAREAVASVLEEADALASRAHALAPWREAPTKIDGIPCRCGAVGTLHDFGDVRKCARCGASFDEIHWAAMVKVLAHRFGQEEGIAG